MLIQLTLALAILIPFAFKTRYGGGDEEVTSS
jgi:hypothetical protein